MKKLLEMLRRVFIHDTYKPRMTSELEKARLSQDMYNLQQTIAMMDRDVENYRVQRTRSHLRPGER